MITVKAKELKSFKEKSIGLIGAKEVNPVFFKTRFGIHTFSLNFSLDIIVLDNKNRAIKIKKGLKPNRIFLWNLKFDSIIELKSGAIEEKGIKLGDIIQLDLAV